MPAVFRIIKNNYEILKRYELYTLEQGEKKFVRRYELEKQGFHFGYCTSANKVNSQDTWLYCFELGYLESGPSTVYLKYDEYKKR